MENLKYTEILRLNAKLALQSKGKVYRIGILANVTVNPIKEILEYNCRAHEIEPLLEIGNFDNIVQDSAAGGDKDLVIVIYDLFALIDKQQYFGPRTFDSLLEQICLEIDTIFNNLRQQAAVVFNLFSAAGFAPGYGTYTLAEQLADRLNQYLKDKCPSNTILLDIDKIISRLGVKQALDMRFYYSSKAPYSISFLKEYVLALQPQLLKQNGKLKKALIFDCDNTLWKGIIGEDGIDGIEYAKSTVPGRYFAEVQQLAARLSEQGVLIGLCSKNNPEEVKEVLQKNDALLRPEHIVIQKVNWQDKANNLAAIAAELNIGTDSLVFVDDAPFEINLIKEKLPEVLTFQVPEVLMEYSYQLEALVNRYFNTHPNKEDAAKTRMYKEQSEREASKNAFASIDDYLASLEIKLSISLDNIDQIARVAQLTQKTNQFNLTTIRYTENEIAQLMQSADSFVYALSVNDKFGDSGLTGVCIVRGDSKNTSTARIDTLLMSCRIIGRNIEHVFFNYIVNHLKKEGYKTLEATYVPTRKNMQVADFYKMKGMQRKDMHSDNNVEYTMDLADFTPSKYNYITIQS